MPIVNFRHRDPKNINLDAFHQHLASSSLVTAPSDDPDTCMDTFLSDVGASPDKEAPMRNFSRRRSHVANYWLSSEAADTKTASRQLKRKFIRLRTMASYVAYKPARTTANESVIRQRGQFIANKVADASGNPRSLWHNVNRLLHPSNAGCVYGGCHHANVTLPASFSAFCCDKLRRVKDLISSMLQQYAAIVAIRCSRRPAAIR